jgi:hypothetical protein
MSLGLYLLLVYSKVVIVDDLGLSNGNIKNIRIVGGNSARVGEITRPRLIPNERNGEISHVINGGGLQKNNVREDIGMTANKVIGSYERDKGSHDLPLRGKAIEDTQKTGITLRDPDRMNSLERINIPNYQGYGGMDNDLPGSGTSSYARSDNPPLADTYDHPLPDELSGGDSYSTVGMQSRFGGRHQLDFPPSNLQPRDYPLHVEAEDLVRQEKENLIDAGRARSTYLSLKYTESQQREDGLQRMYEDVNSKMEGIENKLRERHMEEEGACLDLISLKNHKKTLLSNKRSVESDRDKMEAKIRLNNNEISHLSKKLDDLRAKSVTMKDEREVYDNRAKVYDRDLSKVDRDLSSEEVKLGEYKKEIFSLENLVNELRNKREELIAKKSRESTLQSRLDMEKERVSRNEMFGMPSE